MKHRASLSNLHLGFLPVACVLLPTLVLVGGCGGSAVSGGDGAGVAGGANAGSASTGSAGSASTGSAGSASTGSAGSASTGSAGSASTGSAGSPAAGSGSAGAPSGGSGAGGSGTMGASCTVGDKTYPSGSSFLGPDGCGQCNCFGGQVACTAIGCVQPPPQLCGGIAGIACAKGEYCKYPDGAQCGAGDQSGECSTTPSGCLADFAPVCGCDGKAYGNACSAASAGVSVAHTGACSPPAGSCSVTVDGVSYPDGTSNIPAGDGCNVCTCNKSTLSCSARPCKAPTPCGAVAGFPCTADEYCAYRPGSLCGQADAEAVCLPRPSACSTLDQPVCGCDSKTYLNTCSAALAGTGVIQTGACPVSR